MVLTLVLRSAVHRVEDRLVGVDDGPVFDPCWKDMMTMTTQVLSRVTDELFNDAETRPLSGFLGGYSGLTREAYALDLRQFAQWCHNRRIALFAVGRHDIEAFARHLEDLGRARATISRRLRTITCLYRYPSKKDCSITPRLSTSAGRGWITSRTPRVWTATKSGRCSSPPVSPAPAITP